MATYNGMVEISDQRANQLKVLYQLALNYFRLMLLPSWQGDRYKWNRPPKSYQGNVPDPQFPEFSKDEFDLTESKAHLKVQDRMVRKPDNKHMYACPENHKRRLFMWMRDVCSGTNVAYNHEFGGGVTLGKEEINRTIAAAAERVAEETGITSELQNSDSLWDKISGLFGADSQDVVKLYQDLVDGLTSREQGDSDGQTYGDFRAEDVSYNDHRVLQLGVGNGLANYQHKKKYFGGDKWNPCESNNFTIDYGTSEVEMSEDGDTNGYLEVVKVGHIYTVVHKYIAPRLRYILFQLEKEDLLQHIWDANYNGPYNQNGIGGYDLWGKFRAKTSGTLHYWGGAIDIQGLNVNYDTREPKSKTGFSWFAKKFWKDPQKGFGTWSKTEDPYGRILYHFHKQGGWKLGMFFKGKGITERERILYRQREANHIEIMLRFDENGNPDGIPLKYRPGQPPTSPA